MAMAKDAVQKINGQYVSSSQQLTLETEKLPSPGLLSVELSRLQHISRVHHFLRHRQIGRMDEKLSFSDYLYNILWWSLKYSVANCFEQSIIALLYLMIKIHMNAYPACRLSCYLIHGGEFDASGHVFVLISADSEKTHLTNHYFKRNTGELNPCFHDAVVCDPWAGDYYPLKNYRARLNYYMFDKKNAKGYLVPFNPEKHKINILTKRQQVVMWPSNYFLSPSFLNDVEALFNYYGFFTTVGR